MDSKRERFMSRYFGKGWRDSQEDMFYGALVNLVRNGLTDEGVPALSGAYLNSYQRLMGILVQEVGTRSTPASKMVLKSFLSWEREIRKELTEPAWEVRALARVVFWVCVSSFSLFYVYLHLYYLLCYGTATLCPFCMGPRRAYIRAGAGASAPVDAIFC